MAWHQNEIGAAVFITPNSNAQALVQQFAKYMPAGLQGVKVLECVALFGLDEIMCRVHADPIKDGPSGHDRIALWVNGLATDLKQFVKGTRTHIVAFEHHP